MGKGISVSDQFLGRRPVLSCIVLVWLVKGIGFQ